MKLVYLALITACALAPRATARAGERPYRLAELDANGVPPLLENVSSTEDWERKRSEIAKAWLTTVGGIPPRAPVRFEVLEETREPTHVLQRIVFDAAGGDRIPALLLIPHDVHASKRKTPAVLALHPTSVAGKDAIARPTGAKDRMYALELAARGYVVLAPDDLTAGERVFPGLRAFRDKPFYEQHPHWTTVGKNLVDHLQAVDLLVSLPFVDAEKIGVIGHSFGGYNGYFLSAMDARIRAVVSSCGLSPFARSPKRAHWGIRDWYTHFPSISADLERGTVPFDFNEIIALSAPTPLFIYVAQEDRGFPHWVSVGECLIDVRTLYAWMGKADRFQSMIGSGGHDFPPAVREMSYRFLDQWLRGPTETGQAK